MRIRIYLFLIIFILILMLLVFLRKPEYYELLPTSNLYPNNRKYSNIREITECSDSEFDTSITQRGDYFVISNYVKGSRRFKCHESVTYATHGDYSFLDNLVDVLNKWQGPISVSLYTPGEDFEPTMKLIAYLRNCQSPLVKEFVTFHIFFHSDHFPKTQYELPLNEAYTDIYLCHKGHPNVNTKTENLYRRNKKLIYPINIGRNVAIQASQTHFVLSSDIEQYPSKNFIKNFLNGVESYDGLKNKSPKVFVVPVFEVEKDARVPETKADLIKMFEEKKAFWFHKNLCAECHKIPGQNNWLHAGNSSEKFIHATGKRTENELKKSEPIYVGTVHEPFYDERLSWEGLSDKLAQAYIMCLLDYEFVVLLNEFLVHKPGVATGMESIKKFGDHVLKTNKFIVDTIKPQCEAMYGSRDECVMK